MLARPGELRPRGTFEGPRKHGTRALRGLGMPSVARHLRKIMWQLLQALLSLIAAVFTSAIFLPLAASARLLAPSLISPASSSHRALVILPPTFSGPRARATSAMAAVIHAASSRFWASFSSCGLVVPSR